MCYGGGKVKSNLLEKNDSYTYIKIVREKAEKNIQFMISKAAEGKKMV